MSPGILIVLLEGMCQKNLDCRTSVKPATKHLSHLFFKSLKRAMQMVLPTHTPTWVWVRGRPRQKSTIHWFTSVCDRCGQAKPG